MLTERLRRLGLPQYWHQLWMLCRHSKGARPAGESQDRLANLAIGVRCLSVARAFVKKYCRGWNLVYRKEDCVTPKYPENMIENYQRLNAFFRKLKEEKVDGKQGKRIVLCCSHGFSINPFIQCFDPDIDVKRVDYCSTSVATMYEDGHWELGPIGTASHVGLNEATF